MNIEEAYNEIERLKKEYESFKINAYAVAKELRTKMNEQDASWQTTAQNLLERAEKAEVENVVLKGKLSEMIIVKATCLACSPDVKKAYEELEVKNTKLHKWKESQINVENSLNVQEIAKEIGLKWGDKIRFNILPYIRKIKAENAALWERLKPVEEVYKKYYYAFAGLKEAIDREDFLWQAICKAMEEK